MDEDLVTRLESPLPAALPAGRPSVVFCVGTCFHRRERVAGVELVVAGEHRHRPAASGMPRPDVRDVDPAGLRSGFWGTVRIPAYDRPGTVELELEARLATGIRLRAPLGRIEISAPAPAPRLGRPAGPGLIAVCMATYEPDPARLRRQLATLRAQTDTGWVCVVSDDASSPERWEQLVREVGEDPRFTLSRAPRRLGFYRNFERALGMAPAEAELVALCDQDDEWAPDKLAVLRGALGGAQLAYSDQRLVDADGRVLRATMWEGRRNNHRNLASLLIANTITGAATLFRREVAELALPFPDAPGVQFHDHWLGLVALASGEIAYVDRPLYDYVQHPDAVFGRVGDAGRGRRSLLRGGRAAYFHGYVAREVQAQALLARCGGRLSAGKRRALERYVAAERSPVAMAWLAGRTLRAVAGRNETLGSELDLVRGIAWRRLAAVLPRWADSRFPPEADFEQRRLQRWRARV